MSVKNFSFDLENIPTQSALIDDAYQENGIICIRDFLNLNERHNMLSELAQIESDAIADCRDNWQNKKCVFYSRNAQNEPYIKNDFVSEPYFLASQDKVHIFYENHDGALFVNRIGHGMHLYEQYPHLQNSVYDNHYLHYLLEIIGFVKPICHLSVYIPKFGNEMGSVVRSHQEATFVHTQPQSVVVLWIALEDADIDNACMWGILGSNQWKLKYLSVFNHQTKVREFQLLTHVPIIPDFEKGSSVFTPLAVKAGDALLFHGNFIHCSPKNTSSRSRKALSMQFIETANTKYLTSNWIRQPNNKYLY